MDIAIPQTLPTPDALRAPPLRQDLFDDALRAVPRASGDLATLGRDIAAGLRGFTDRAKEVGARVPAAFAATEPSGLRPPFDPAMPAATTLPAGEPGPVDPEAAMHEMYGLIVEVFDYAIETHLVAKAATQFTGSINTLLKGQ